MAYPWESDVETEHRLLEDEFFDRESAMAVCLSAVPGWILTGCNSIWGVRTEAMADSHLWRASARVLLIGLL